MIKRKKQTILVAALILSMILIISGVTYAFFSYTRQGTTDNTITTGSITFLYTENSGTGRGVSIVDAYPISDTLGKTQTGSDKMFDFKITSNTMSKTAIEYEITARKSKDSTLDEDVVKVYLTKVDGTSEEEIVLSKYSDLTQTSKVSSDDYTEKTLYTAKVPSNTASYEENYRLRMWIDEETDFSGVEQEDGTVVYPYNDKTFKLTVNVYANGKVITEEEVAYEANANISTLSVEGEELTAVEDEDYDYTMNLPEGTTETTINVETENPNATVEVEKIDSLAYSSNIKRLSTSKTLSLMEGNNYFKVKITSENKQNTEEYIIKIYVGPIYDTYSIGEAITLSDGSKWHVLEASDETSSTVVLLSDYNLNSDGTYYTTCVEDYCNAFGFDEDGKQEYDETDSNNIGYFIKNTYEPKVLASLPGTTNITLPTAYQIAEADGQTFNQSKLTLTNSWLFTTDYWTKTPNNTLENYTDDDVWNVFNGGLIISNDADTTLTGGARPTITTLKSNIVETMDSTTSLSIGTAVTATDGSKWHVLEASASGTDTVVLLSDYNLNSDGSYNTTCGYNINSTYTCSSMAYDPDMTNTYDETDSNNIGYFIKNTYEPLVINYLPGSTNITIPTAYQIATADGQTFDGTNISLTNTWSSTTTYWTKTATSTTDPVVWYASSRFGQDFTNNSIGPGARPVITTPKSNLLAQ